jgi:hypothetical protein
MDILLEQLVYGSFPFWDRGYDVLAKSPGCRPEWVSDVLGACRQFGEAPSGVTPSPSLFATRLASGPWAVVGVEPQGQDDRGRPGALAFHALLIPDRDYRRAGSNPFAFAGTLRREWSAGVSLEARFWTVETSASLSLRERAGMRGVAGPAKPQERDLEATGGSTPLTSALSRREREEERDPRVGRIVEVLAQGRRVALESAGPIEGLAREVWLALPESRRRRASVATWAFGNGNRFDLVAVPRLAGLEFDRSYVDLATIDAGSPFVGESARRAILPRPGRRALAVAVLAGLVTVGLAWRGMDGPKDSRIPTREAPASVDLEPPIDPEERARIVDGLEAMADRFESFEIGRWGDPSELMARISDRLRYRGATLSEADRGRLAADPDPDRDRALAWHDRIKAFANDRPLSGDFARLPLRRQLAEFARSFHLDPPPEAGAVPGFVAESLARDGPIRPTPLASRYPALSDYARFLGRLPRGSHR